MFVRRLIIIFLISIALPLSNLATAAMVHCAQTTKAPDAAVTMTDHASHAHHHEQMQEQATADHHQHDGSAGGHPSCDHCSYCQSCSSAFVPPTGGDMPRLKISTQTRHGVPDMASQSVLEQLYRPPRFAFA